MRRITLGLMAGTAVLAGSSALAADELVTTATSPLLQEARLMCDSFGNCWNTAPRRRVIVNGAYDAYNYAPRRYYGDPYSDTGPGVGVWGPGFGIGFGFGPRPYW